MVKEKIYYVSPAIFLSSVLDSDETDFEALRKEIQSKKINISEKTKMNSSLTYEYYNKYMSILKKKIGSLIDIMEVLIGNSVINASTNEVNSLIEQYDLDIDFNGNISSKDLLRIVKPLIYNIKELNRVEKEANNLDSYKRFVINPEDINNPELYPCEELQEKNDEEGCIPLTEKQKKKMKIYNLKKGK